VESTPRQQSSGQRCASSHLQSAECNPQGAGSVRGPTSSPRGVSNKFQAPAASPRMNVSPRMFRMFGSSGVHNSEISELAQRVTFMEEYQAEMLHRIEQLETWQSEFRHALSQQLDSHFSKSPCKADRLQHLDMHVQQLGTTVALLQDDLSAETVRLGIDPDSSSVSARAELLSEIMDASFLCHQMGEISRNLEQRYMLLKERLPPSVAACAQSHHISVTSHPGSPRNRSVSMSSLASDDRDALISEALASDEMAEADVDIVDLDGTRHATSSVQGYARTPPMSARRRALPSCESMSSLASDTSSPWRKNTSLPDMEIQEVLPSSRWPQTNPAKREAGYRLELEGSSKWAHDASSSLEPKERGRLCGSPVRPPWADPEQDGCGAEAALAGASLVTPHTNARQSTPSVRGRPRLGLSV